MRKKRERENDQQEGFAVTLQPGGQPGGKDNSAPIFRG